jgi:hypothetical protein
MAYNNEHRGFFWICAVITGLSAFVSSGFSIAAMMGALHNTILWAGTQLRAVFLC